MEGELRETAGGVANRPQNHKWKVWIENLDVFVDVSMQSLQSANPNEPASQPSSGSRATYRYERANLHNM
jgi:hypothetical protein